MLCWFTDMHCNIMCILFEILKHLLDSGLREIGGGHGVD